MKERNMSYNEINIIIPLLFILFAKLISSKFPEYIDFLFLWEFAFITLVCLLYHYQDCFTTKYPFGYIGTLRWSYTVFFIFRYAVIT